MVDLSTPIPDRTIGWWRALKADDPEMFHGERERVKRVREGYERF